MKILSFENDGVAGFGRVEGNEIADLTSAGTSVLECLRAGRFPEPRSGARRFALDRVKLLPPVPDPEKIFCVGVNYANRNEEYRDGSERPKYPSLFMRSRDSFAGHESPIVCPRESDQFDYEGEIVLVIGKAGRRIAKERALEHIAGMTLCNEGSVRDWLRHGKFNVTQGKNFDASGSIGPWLVTVDEIDPAQPLELVTRVNGEVRQHDTTANLIFPFEELIAYISTFATLKPGDIIVTGTPTGAGARFDPPRWLKDGDVVEVEVPGLGLLRNAVVKER